MNIQADIELAEGSSYLADVILDDIADALIFADRSGTIRRWNRAAVCLFGYSVAEALGQSLDLIVPEHLRALHWRGFNAAMTNGVLSHPGRSTLTRVAHKSERRVYVEMTFALVDGAVGEPVLGAVAVARDVTDRIEQERAPAAATIQQARAA